MLSIVLSLLSLLSPLPRTSVAPDSIDVLLLSIPMVDSIVINNAADASLDGRPVRGQLVGIGVDGKDGIVAGTHRGVILLATSSRGRPWGIRAGDRSRSAHGTLRVSASDGRLVIVARLGLSDYLAGVLAEESAARDPIEYRVALSFLQRNFAVNHAGRHAPHADVCDNTHCQLFRSTGQRAATREAVRRGSAIRWDSTARPCFYSSCCGGATLTPADVWGRHEGGYARVQCRTCRSSRWYRWRSSVSAGPAADALFARLPAAPFVSEESKIELGRALGWRLVPSNTIDEVVRREGRWHLAGRGFGHRVGLCQAGARTLALRGRNAEEILRYYFPQGDPDSPRERPGS